MEEKELRDLLRDRGWVYCASETCTSRQLVQVPGTTCFQCGLLHRPQGYVVEEAGPLAEPASMPSRFQQQTWDEMPRMTPTSDTEEEEEEEVEEEQEDGEELEEGETGSPAQGQRRSGQPREDGASDAGVAMQAQHFVAGFGQPEGPGQDDHGAGFPPVALPPPQHRRNIVCCCYWARKFKCSFPHCRSMHSQPLTPIQQVEIATGRARLVCERQVKYGFCQYAGTDHI